MAVSNNPYISWEDSKNSRDYRSRESQLFSYVRQQLNEDRYLNKENRINPGRKYLSRKISAENNPQDPHLFGKEDVWGYQRWAELNTSTGIQSDLVDDLLEAPLPGIPGTDSYNP